MGLQGPIGLITAGWQEREPEDDELKEALGIPSMNLQLYARWEDIQSRDSEFHALHRVRQDRVRKIQDLYRVRLAHLMASAFEIFASKGPADLLASAEDDAVQALRDLDAAHLVRIAHERAESERVVQPSRRPVIATHQREVALLVQECEAIAVAGGHVAILLNRLRLFGLDTLLATRPVIAWSAGAMTLSERVILFHDHTPQGDGHPDVLDQGLGLARDVVVLPHARHRLDLGRRDNLAILARRFAPAACLPMNERHRALWDGRQLHLGPGLAPLERSGETGADFVALPAAPITEAEALSVSDMPAPAWSG